jgi:hypothetical protein
MCTTVNSRLALSSAVAASESIVHTILLESFSDAVPFVGDESPVILKQDDTVSLITMFCAPGVIGSSSVFGTAVRESNTLNLPPQEILSVLSDLFAKIIPISSFLSVVLNTVYEKIWVCVIIFLELIVFS